uniref:Retrotransposon gag domain-containing protein n=1 Tax=Fagus sylvatica TaxID=28930 RepID=A0A2N9GM77_FAGSY
MAGETSGPDEHEVRMIALERKFDKLLNFVHLMYADNEPLLIQAFQDTLTGHAAEWYSQLKKISQWKELANTFLAQYGFNSQIALDRFDLQRMEKKSGESFREYAQRWREKVARARPPLDEKEMIKIFVDMLKNPYFDRMIGLQLQFFVDLIPVGEIIEDAVKTKKIIDMSALMALAEQTAKKAPAKRKEGDNQPRPTPIPTLTPAPAPAPALQMPARPMGNQANDYMPAKRELRQFTPLPMLLMQLYPIMVEKKLVSPTIPMPRNGPPLSDFDQNLTCDFHYGEVGHAVENCRLLRQQVQDLINHGILKFEGLPNITTDPLPNHPEGNVNMVEVEGKDDGFDLASGQASWKHLFHALKEQGYLTPLEAPAGPSKGDICEYHSGARGHSLECCEEFKKEVASLAKRGLIRKGEVQEKGGCISTNLTNVDQYEEINLDDVIDEESFEKYRMKEEEMPDANAYRGIDFSNLFWFPNLIIPRGFEAPEFENFDEYEDPEIHLQKYYEKMAQYTENELLMYRFNPEAMLDYLELGDEEELYLTPDPAPMEKNEVIVEIEGNEEIPTLPAKDPNISTTTKEEVHTKQTKPQSMKDPDISTTEEEVRTKQIDPPPAEDSIPPTEDKAQRTFEIQS